MVDSQAARILIVDDSPADRALLRRYLEANGHGSSIVAEVECGEHALRLCESEAFSCIFLDYLLPDISGLELLQTLRRRLNKPLPVVVMMTGLGDEQVAVDAIKAGALDYIAKDGLNQNVVSRALRMVDEHARLMEVSSALREVELQLEVAWQIQQRLLPDKPPDLPGFDVHGACLPAKSAAGDFFDFFPLADGRTGILVADVSSKGIGPALIMAGTRGVIRTVSTVYSELGRIMELANAAVYHDTDPERFVTLFLAAIDPETRTLTYVGAGHRALLFDPSGHIETLPSTALPLGLMSPISFVTTRPQHLLPGQILLMSTDGLDEAFNDDGQLFGLNRVKDLVRENRDKPAEQICHMLFDAVYRFSGSHDLLDDVTIVVTKVNAGA